MASLPSLIAFDLDGTLAASKQPIESSMAATLTQLLGHAKVAVTSGGKLEQLAKQVADRLPADADRANLYFLPTSGAALFQYENESWQRVYEESLSGDEVVAITAMMESVMKTTRVIDTDVPSHGPRIEARGAQVTLSALGQQAPIDEKKAWDPTHEKRKTLRAALAVLLPAFDVKVGGSTSIDVTKKGVNKAYGIRKLSEHLSIPISDMLYVGDELSEGGNDSVVIETGIKTHAVKNPEETSALIESLLA